MSESYVPLGEIATLQAGIGFPLDLQGRKTGLYPFAKVGDISRCGRTGNSVLHTADHFVDQQDIAKLRVKPVPIGSILFAKIGEAIRQNHRVIAGCQMLIDNNAMAAIPGPKVDGKFLYHYLKTVDFYCLAPATTVPALRKSELEGLLIPLPLLQQQRRIAAILDQADALRAIRREALAQLDSLTQSIFIEMFGDPVANSKGWPILPFRSQIESVRYGTGSPPPYVDSGIPFIRATNVKAGRISTKDLRRISNRDAEKLAKCRVKRGNIIIVRSGVNTGDCAVIPAEYDGSCAAFDLIVDIDYLDAVFFGFLINSEYGRSILEPLSRRAAQPHLNAEQLRSLPLMAPPADLRRVFAKRVEAVDTIRATHSTALNELDSLFQSLQHRAFRGEL